MSTLTGSTSAWGPLRQPIFRALWLAALASNVGTLMHGVAAAWVMTSLTTSPLPVALLTTAGSLPVVIVGLPAGALADIVDRRWLVIFTQLWMLVVAALLGVTAIAGWMTPWLLLTLTFVLGIGGALSAPAWGAIIPQLVGKRDLGHAIALNSAGFNLARAVGPAIGGLLVAAAGPGFVFLLNGLSFLGVMIVMYRWKPAPHATSGPSETVRSAVAAGMRYTRHSQPLRAILVRTAAFVIPASALWALLPVVASRELHLQALGYGVLLASLGVGAVLGAVALPSLRARLPVNQVLMLGTVIFLGGTLTLAYIHNIFLLNAVLVVVGLAWLTSTSCLNVATQTMAASWVSARALGVYLLVFQGGFAGGSALWGEIARRYNNQTALATAAVLLLAGLTTALRWPLRTGEDLDLSPSAHWPEPKLSWEPDPADGPVMITVTYSVPAAQAGAFVTAMSEIQVLRRRDGALRWELYRDPTLPDRYVEAYEVGSWAEHLRQHERTTVLDREVERRALDLLLPGTTPAITHLVASRRTGSWGNATTVPAEAAVAANGDHTHGADRT